MYTKQPEKSQVFHFKGVGKLSSANARKLGTPVEREKYVLFVCLFPKGEERLLESTLVLFFLFFFLSVCVGG